jgi:predicted nucleic acid-binding protein
VGPAEIVLVVSSPVPAKNRTLGDFATSEFFGMWRDRTDIIDSVQFARQLRSDGWKRSALMVLVDTDVLVDCLQGTEAARQWLEHTPRELLSIPGVVAMELVIGCRNRTEFRAFRSFYIVVWPEATEFARAYELLAEYRLSSGLGIPDCIIGAMALVRAFAPVGVQRKTLPGDSGNRRAGALLASVGG